MKVIKTHDGTYLMKGWLHKRLWLLKENVALEVGVINLPTEEVEDVQPVQKKKPTK